MFQHGSLFRWYRFTTVAIDAPFCLDARCAATKRSYQCSRCDKGNGGDEATRVYGRYDVGFAAIDGMPVLPRML